MAKKDLMAELGNKLKDKDVNWDESKAPAAKNKNKGRGRPKLAVKRETIPLRLLPKYKKLLKKLAIETDLKYGEVVETALELYKESLND